MGRTTLAVLGSLSLLAATTTIRAGQSGTAPHDWDRAAVATYLDHRMDVWWSRAKTLKTGNSEVKCLSCHTALPYALARPALRAADGVGVPTAHETRILDIARQRATYAADDQPYYDHTEDKKREAVGVEAVVNAVLLTSDDEARKADASGATRAAMARMWAVQRGDGAWDWLDFGLEPYEAPDAIFHGATLAAIAAGSSAGQQASMDPQSRAGVERLKNYLQMGQASQRTFNRVWLLLASSRLAGVLTASERESILQELEARQRSDGGWSLADLGVWRWGTAEAPFVPPGSPDATLLAAADGYATGLVVYAMRQSGVSMDRDSVRRGQAWLRTHQVQGSPDDEAWAPWRAHSLNHDREHGGPRGEAWRRMFMSDLATAFAALALL
jgi:hypothetical protein